MGSGCNALSTVVLQTAVTQVAGEVQGGIFAIGFAIAQLMWTIGSFEMNTYQVTDVTDKFRFSHYFAFKLLLCGAMLLCSAVDILLRGYDPYKATVALLLCLYRMIDAFSGLFYGQFQKIGRLDLSGKSFFARVMLSMLTLIAVLWVTRNLIWAILAACIISSLWILCYEVPISAGFDSFRPEFDWSRIWRLFLDCFPLFAGSFILMYIYNIPKYAIDNAYPEQIQTYFSFLFMPASFINLLSIFLFRPMLTTLAKQWNDRDLKKFLSLVSMLLVWVAGVTVFALAVAYFVGIPFLSLLCGANLSAYRKALLLILVGGNFSAASTVLYNVVTVLRRQRALLLGYGIAALISYLISPSLVGRYEINGASFAYLISMAILFLSFALLFLWYFMHDKNKRGENA